MKLITTFVTLLALAGVTHAAVLVTPTGITSTTSATDLWSAGRLIDNSGLSGAATDLNYTTITHAGVASSNAWVTADPAPSGGDYFAEGNPNPVLTIDLGGTFDLINFVYWGYTFTGNEAKSFTLSFSTTGVGGTFSGDQSFTQATARGTGSAPGDFVLAPVSANAVRITITDNFNGDRVGFGEVKFLAVPEPSIALLGGLGLLALLRRRRA